MLKFKEKSITRGLTSIRRDTSIREFSDPSIPILMYGGDGKFIVRTLEEVCPSY